MEQGQQNLDLKINTSECLFEAGNCEDLHVLEQIPTLESDSSSSPKKQRAEDFVELEQKVQVREIVAEDTTLCDELPTTASLIKALLERLENKPSSQAERESYRLL